MTVTAAYCMVEGCKRAPAARETYQGPGAVIVDEVCSAHTGRLGAALPMLSNESVSGQAKYQMEANR